MTARVLVVDDVAANVKLLDARLSPNISRFAPHERREALAICERANAHRAPRRHDADMDGFDVCRQLKSNPVTHHIPVVMVTALDQPPTGARARSGRRRFPHQAGVGHRADRARSLARALKLMTDELRMARDSREIGIESPEREAVAETGATADPGGRRPGRIRGAPAEDARGSTRSRRGRPERGLVPRREGNYDLLIVSSTGRFRCLAALQPGPFARSHAQRADLGDRGR